MEELIKIGTSTKTGNPVVNARDLYTFLEAKHTFSAWIRELITKYQFVENKDYARVYYDVRGNVLTVRLSKNGETDVQGLIHKIDYALTMDCAKEIAMVQNNFKGSQARQYFIDVERKYVELKNKAIGATYNMSQIANDLNMGKYKMLEQLRLRSIFTNENMPRLIYIEKGYFARIPHAKYKYLKQTVATELGKNWLKPLFLINDSIEAVKTVTLPSNIEKRLSQQEGLIYMLIESNKAMIDFMLSNQSDHQTKLPPSKQLALTNMLNVSKKSELILNSISGQKALAE